MPIAAYNGHATAIRALRDAGGDVSAISANGFTPLFIAKRNKYDNEIRVLTELGAKLERSTLFWKTGEGILRA